MAKKKKKEASGGESVATKGTVVTAATVGTEQSDEVPREIGDEAVNVASSKRPGNIGDGGATEGEFEGAFHLLK